MSKDAQTLTHCYRSVEWSAPERLALTSLLHGGPCPDLNQYRVLELGCGNGANLIPLAYYRHQAQFIGIDSEQSNINIAIARSEALQQPNLKLLNVPAQQLTKEKNGITEGPFDFILAHNLFSYLTPETRDALLEQCQRWLKPHGLLYLNYNSKPGWNVRGMIREYLLAHTHSANSPQQRAQQAQAAASKMARSLSADQSPYSKLLAEEFQRVITGHPEDVARELLGEHQQAYWRSEFLQMAERFELHFVADADFNQPGCHAKASRSKQIESQDLIGTNLMDTVDLIGYRQSHAAVFSKQPVRIPQPEPEALAKLHIASCLHPVGPHRPGWYQHPNGYQLQAQEPDMAAALNRLQPLWPESLPISSLMEPSERRLNDLVALHNTGLLELRLPDAIQPSPSSNPSPGQNPLNQLELQWYRGYTTAYHQWVEGN